MVRDRWIVAAVLFVTAVGVVLVQTGGAQSSVRLKSSGSERPTKTLATSLETPTPSLELSLRERLIADLLAAYKLEDDPNALVGLTSALVRHGLHDREVAVELVDALPLGDTRSAAMYQALSQALDQGLDSFQTKNVVQALIPALKHEDAEVRRMAAALLTKVDPAMF